MRRGILWTLVLIFLFLPILSCAAGRFTVFTEKSVPSDLGFRVNSFSGEVTMTFLGDCTFGGEEKSRTNYEGFVRVVERNGMDFPMRNLSALTLQDDISVINLEGVLTDRELDKVEKKYNFSGSTAYTEILNIAGIECVNLANNHSHDYGDEGYRDTREALEKAGVSWFGEEEMAVWENPEGMLIGFVGVFYSLNGKREAAFTKRMKILRDLGCSAIVAVMHTGDEYKSAINGYQEQIARWAVKNGADLVIGHHPHVVQGLQVIRGVPVVYSLGNCSFGGAIRPRDYDALAVQAVMRFEDSEHVETELRLYPIRVSSVKDVNNFCPVFLKGANAQRVMEKMRKSTGYLPVFLEEEGFAREVYPAP